MYPRKSTWDVAGVVVWGLLAAMACCGLAGTAYAQCQTPKVTTVKVFRGQADIFPDKSCYMTDELTDQGYD